MTLKLFHRLTVWNPQGTITHDTGLRPAHSYLLQSLQLIEGFYRGTDAGGVSLNAKDTSAASSPIVGAAWNTLNMGRVDAAVGDVNYGILVGTNAGVTAEDNTNYMLDTKILHSITGEAGKLNYRAVTMVAARAVGLNIDFDIARPFVNESGNTITVKEIGLACKNIGDTKYHLLIRDVCADTDVDDDETVTVVYTLRTTA